MRLSIHKKTILICGILFFILTIARIVTLYPTLSPNHQDTFRIGIIPINDGSDWIDRAQTILEGKKINIRPLFSVFLSLFIYVFGINFPKLIALTISLNVISVLLAFYILRKYLHNIFILLLLAAMAVWRMSFLADMMTENLAFSLYIISFSLFIRGIASSKFHFLLAGIMITGLIQAIRPWDIFTLLMLPLYPIAYLGFKKRSYKLAAILLLASMLGFSFSIIDSKMFSTSEQDKLDRAFYLHGQMSGGRGFFYWLLDPEIKAATIKHDKGILSTRDVENIVYRKAFKAFKDNPMNFVKGTIKGFIWFTTKIHMIFQINRINVGYFSIIFILLVFLFIPKPIIFIKESFSIAPITKIIVLIFSLFLFSYQNTYFLSLFAIIGLIASFKIMDKRNLILIGLYLVSIILTVFTIGPVGGDRMWMSPELIGYYLSSLGIAYFFFNQKNIFTPDKKDISISRTTCLKYSILLMSVFTLAFVIMPLFTQYTFNEKEKVIKSKISPSEIAKDLGIKAPIVSKETLIDNILLWPLPTFEKINGNWAYWRTTYRSFKAFDMEKNEGLYSYKWRFSKWHLMAMSFPRVGFDDRNPIIFPYTTKEQLSRFENTDIVILGKLVGRKRDFFTHQGFMIIAEYVGYPDESGNIKWIKIKDL